jgi:hypothetical protein
MAGYVNAVLLHGFYRERVNAMRFHTGTVHLCPVARKILKITFRYLAAAAVTRTENQYFLHTCSV